MTLDKLLSLSKPQLLHLLNRLRIKCDAISEVLSQQGVNESPEQSNPSAPHPGNIFLFPMPPVYHQTWSTSAKMKTVYISPQQFHKWMPLIHRLSFLKRRLTFSQHCRESLNSRSLLLFLINSPVSLLGFLKASCVCLPIPLLVCPLPFWGLSDPSLPFKLLHIPEDSELPSIVQNFSLILSLFRESIDWSVYVWHVSQLLAQ